MENNPEQELIDLIVGQIEDDERILEGLGGGTLSLEDVEAWRSRRWQAEKRFMSESGRWIGAMREKGFGRMMSRSKTQTFGQSSRRSSRAPQRRSARRKRPAEAATRPTHRFVLDLADLGLPCSLTVTGAYDDVLDAGTWHARHIHHLKGSPSSVRDTVKSAIVEERVSPVSAEERSGGLRGEEQVSDEARNQTRSGYASA
jgi:hypothetical protein